MKAVAIAFVVLVAAPLIGCGRGSESSSQDGSVELRMIAEPKTGVHEVTAYDPPAVRAAASGQFEQVDYSFLPNIIVWLVPEKPEKNPPSASLALDLDPSKPSDDVSVATVGQKILFKNSSQRPLNAYSVSDGNEFELTIAPAGSSEYIARGEGLVEVLADPAQPPIAQIYVVPSRWVARVHSGEKVTFDHLPPGKYQAFAWHPRLPGASIALDVAKGEPARGTLKIGVNNLQPATSP
jgi:hypothetical protein